MNQLAPGTEPPSPKNAEQQAPSTDMATQTEATQAEAAQAAVLEALWDNSPEKTKTSRYNQAITAVLVVGFFVAAYSVWTTFEGRWYLKMAYQAALFVIYVFLSAVVVAIYQGVVVDPTKKRVQATFVYSSLQYEMRRAEEAAESLSLTSLWLLNQRRLDYYHTIATNQSRTSFRYGQLASVVGFLLLASSATGAWFAPSAPVAIAAGAAGVTAGALSGFVGATFMRSHETASAQLREYFAQPLEFSKLLAAERLANGLKDSDKSEAIRTLISGIVQLPMEPGSSAGDN